MNVKDIKTIAMYGAGTIGGGFAAYFALKGLNVNVYVRSEASKERAIPHIQGPIDSYVKLWSHRRRPEDLGQDQDHHRSR